MAAEHAEDLAHNIDVILQDQDVRQRRHPGEQNRKDECYGVDQLLPPTHFFGHWVYKNLLLYDKIRY